MQPTMGRGLKWSIVAGLSVLAVLAGLYASFFFTDPSGGVMTVAPSDGEPVATLDPERTNEQVPELARALDEALSTRERTVVIRGDQEQVDEVIDYMVAETGDYTDPFLWRGVVFRLGYSVP